MDGTVLSIYVTEMHNYILKNLVMNKGDSRLAC